jgi:hypothetical protein
MLESAGYAEAAETTVQAAVDTERREQFEARAMQFSAAPPGAPGLDRAAVRALSTEDREARGREIASAYLEVASHRGPPTPNGPRWRSLGPWTIPDGQTYGSSRVNVSGRVSALAVDPSDPAHVLAGPANGGVWESFDRGGSWAPRTDDAPTLAVGALAFDPSNPKTVYCGTGEGDWWWFLGAGVLRSTDGGTNWSVLCGAPFEGQGFYDLLVDPANGQHLLAGTTGGLYVSTDGGIN